MTDLYLDENDLTGSIPAKLGDLSSLRNLWLSGNGLTGSIPKELGNLSSLSTLFLYENDLTGLIPAGLGQLSGLRGLRLSGNRLTDSIPAALGDLSSLTSLWLNDNAGLNGPLPVELADTMTLDSFHYADTGLCVPDNASFRSWLAGISDHIGTGVVCSSSSSGDAAARAVLNTPDSALLTSPRRRPRPRS